MQAITILGLGLCLAVLFFRARAARTQPPSSLKQRLGTAKMLLGVLVVWLLISMNLRHLDRAISGEPKAPLTTWEKIIVALSDWGL